MPLTASAGHFCRLAIAVAAIVAAARAPDARADERGGELPQSSTLQNEAQRLDRYYERGHPTTPLAPDDPLPVPESNAPAQVLPSTGGAQARFVLNRVEFTESALLDTEELQDAVAPFIGRAMLRADLTHMLDRVNSLYTSRHITTARAVLQTQAIVHGVVVIELVEGRLSALRVEGTRPKEDAFVRRRIHLQTGAVVDSDRLRQDLIYLNRTSSINAQALLQPGAARGQTEVLIQVQGPQRLSYGAFVDNNGTDSTGRARVGMQGHLYGLAGADDRLDGNVIHSSGGNNGALSYSIPVSRSNSRVGLSYAHSQVNIINDAFRDLDITGSSSVASLEYRQPFIASLNWMLSGIGSYSLTRSNTRISDESIADTTSRSATLGLSLDHQSDGQRWNVTQLLTRVYSDEPLLGKDTFELAPGSAYFMQRLGRSRWALRTDMGWQWSASKNVPSANLFQIGGLGSVRGYERGVLAGPKGYYVDLELHRAVGERLDVFAFVDYGATLSRFPGRREISGTGLGLSVRWGWFNFAGDVGSALDDVVPDQQGIRYNLRVSANWN